MPNDFQLDCTWEEVQDATDHRNAAVRLFNQNDPDLGNIIMSSLSGSQIYDLVRSRTEVETIRQNVYAVDPSGRRCLLIGEPQTSTSTVVFAVIDGTTQYVYSIPNGGSLVNLTTINMSAIFVTLTYSGGTYTTDTSSSDIYSAKQANYIIKLRDDLGIEYDLQSATSTTAIFSAAIDQSNAVGVVSFHIVGTTVTRITHSAPVVPIPSASDNGKFLTVANGAYTLTSVPAAESGVF